jgi:hypothetical protein
VWGPGENRGVEFNLGLMILHLLDSADAQRPVGRVQAANVCEYAPPDPAGCLRVMLGDVSADVLEIRNRHM